MPKIKPKFLRVRNVYSKIQNFKEASEFLDSFVKRTLADTPTSPEKFNCFRVHLSKHFFAVVLVSYVFYRHLL